MDIKNKEQKAKILLTTLDEFFELPFSEEWEGLSIYLQEMIIERYREYSIEPLKDLIKIGDQGVYYYKRASKKLIEEREFFE
ncbi:MAG: hypothetical protein ACTSVO_08415 [Candidatus Heimdallarchaeaceae archaeon]